MKTKRYFYPLILYFLFCSNLQAQQNPQPHFRNYSTEHGLPSPEVYCVFEDSKGYMWFGTDNGAARFDGYEFKNYGAKEGLKENVVFEIHEDSKGRIWFSTMSGNVYIMDEDSIKPYRFNEKILNYKFRKGELKILDKNDNAYFELEGLGVLKIDSLGKDSLITSSKPVSRIFFWEKEIENLIFTSVSRWYKKRAKKLYIGEYESKKINVEFHLAKKTIGVDLKVEGNSPQISGITGAVLTDQNFLLYIHGTIIQFSKNKIVRQIPFSQRILEIKKDKWGGIWFCNANQAGLMYFKNVDAVFKNDYQLFLPKLTVTNFYQNKDNDIWITTHEKGVFYCNDIELIAFDNSFGLSDSFVSTSTIKSDKELFVGLENGDIFQIDYNSNKILNSFSNPYNHQNFDLFFDSNSNRLWSNGGFFKNNKWQGLKYLFFNGRIGSIISRKFQSQHINKKNQLIGCNNSGFLIADLAKDSIIFYSSYIKDFNRQRTFSVFTNSREQLWVGNVNGIFQFKDSTLIHPNISHPAFHNRVEDIDELSDSILVFGTKGFGIIAWKGDAILQITDDNGLTSNMLEDVHVDENGILWAGTLNGLNKITFDKNGKPIVRTFTTKNGLPSNEIYQIKSYEGQVWLCTAGGLVKFHEAAENTFSPPPILQWAKINDTEQDLTNTSFPYDQNNFEFRYLAINYRMNGEIPYRYRINSKEDWKYTSTLNVNYPSLAPNDYTFEVQAQNEDGYWSESTTYPFTIRPPWWATWWFRTLSILAIGWLGYRFYKYRTDQIRRENDLKNQMSDLEKSALQAQMNPHFIFNCLNSIQNFILKNDTKKAVEYLSRFARLVRHNLNASVQGTITLEEEISILDNYLALERERFEQRFDYQINVDELLQKELLEFPPMLIQPYVENAVVHGIAKKEGQGMVNIEFKKENENLLVTIQDNGIGYRKDQDGTKSKRHKSVGMTITQKRLELLGNADNAVKIKTLTNKHNELQGTLVQILIKPK